jgi:hypothetical protein
VPTLVPRQLLGDTRVGRCHGLREELTLAFSMGTHERLGAGYTADGGCGGRSGRFEIEREEERERESEREGVRHRKRTRFIGS